MADLQRKSLMSPQKSKIRKSRWIDLEAEAIFWPRVFSIIEIWVGSYRKKLLAVLRASQEFWRRPFCFFLQFLLGMVMHLPGKPEVVSRFSCIARLSVELSQLVRSHWMRLREYYQENTFPVITFRLVSHLMSEVCQLASLGGIFGMVRNFLVTEFGYYQLADF